MFVGKYVPVNRKQDMVPKDLMQRKNCQQVL